jgi:DNA-directed RNA polymerase specialized sigma24 family protein
MQLRSHPIPDLTGPAVLRGLVALAAQRDPTGLTALHSVLQPDVYRAAIARLGDADLAEQVTCATFLEVWHLAADHLNDARGVRGWVMGICERRTGVLLRGPHTVGYNALVCEQLRVVLYGEPPAALPHQRPPGTAAGGTPR